MGSVPVLLDAQLGQVSRLLGNCTTNSEITRALNSMVHEPKRLWKGEDDAADYLSFTSLLHRNLNNCAKTGLGGRQ